MNNDQAQILDNFTNTLNELNAVMETVTEDQLDWSAQTPEWTIRQVLHHLTDDGNVFTFIIEGALATPGCKVFFGGFPGNEAWADRLGFDRRPIEPALELLRVQRRFIAELVSCFPDRWSNQVGFYNEEGEKQGEQDVEGLIRMLTDHMGEHIQMITQILASH